MAALEKGENFRKQLKFQLQQLVYGNSDVDGTIEFICDLIGNTEIVDVDATLAEEVRKLRSEKDHLRFRLNDLGKL